MKSIINLILAAFTAMVMAAAPAEIYAQPRHPGGRQSHSQNSSQRQSTPQRSSSSQRQSTPQRSSSSPKKHSSSPQKQSATPQHSYSSRSSYGHSGQSGQTSQQRQSPGRGLSNPDRGAGAPQRGYQPSSRANAGHLEGVHFSQGPGNHIHPAQRDFIRHNAPAPPMHRGPHYFGHRVHYIPHGYICHHYWGRPYYIFAGIYYRPFGDAFVVCRPPYGVFYHHDIVDVVLSAVNFAYYWDTYHNYNAVSDNWRTIQEQNRIIAENNAIISGQNASMSATSRQLSSEAYSLASRLGLVQSYADANVDYYYEDGVFFVRDSVGQYKVIVPPAGALVESLPDDYEEITISGNTYYQVDDTVYRTRITNGKAMFEVLGQFPQ